ncbi:MULTISPECIES: nitrate/nitrite transporter [Microbacterium]|uniref:Sugar phosphate permease n=1 Tax=Microbacterium paraoxydans TaxID=199592 RepID=A0A1H1LYU9_9MICO|nr:MULTISPECIES: MFS transporter [Microbacterium]AMG84521.1 MFS transporter [Microbacterium sp. PAMC 28756]KYJ99131.1 MFS transporter [Microbacterium sp. CH1]MCK2031660.1 MFS transporter [Microbacterium sp. KSW4-4]MCT1394490.1 MFS transporter [Microbacterium sp. p3-SID338]MCT2222585.1 MFS transporter [Microbacterium paraoxydans]
MPQVSHSPVSTPGWRAWAIWSVGVAAYVLAITNRTSLGAVGVEAADRFQADASTLALFAVVQLAVYGGMQIPVGVLLDRYGSRPIITAGMLLMAAGQLTMALSPSIGIAIVARVLLGAGDAAVFPAVLRLVATWFPAQRGPVMVQFTGIIGQAGQLIALVPVAALLHATTWSITFGSIAGLGLLFTILVWLIVRNNPAESGPDVSVNTDTGVVRVVTSAIDTGVGIRAAWAHPGTRLAFWSHFTTPFAGTVFVLLWGMPFLTAGEGLTTAHAAGIISIYVVAGMILGPIIGDLSRRLPNHRSLALVLPAVGVQMAAWIAVIALPGPAPDWLLWVLAIALATGGPASMIAFDHARTHNPAHRLSTATGVTNAGGFIAALIAVFVIGLLLDAQGAGTPDTYTLDAFRVAFLTPIPLWILGVVFILIERKRTRIRMGLDPERRR